MIKAKEDGIVGGADVAMQVFSACDPLLSVVLHRRDGDAVSRGDIILEVKGKLAPLLIGERTALNFMQQDSSGGFRQAGDKIPHRQLYHCSKISHSQLAAP